MSQLDVLAVRDNLPRVLSFVEEQLADYGCGMKTSYEINLAVEEIYVNIASYAYDKDPGSAVIVADILTDPLSLVLVFKDSGTPYNPLLKEDPDTGIPLKERKAGGLGIYMVKKLVDDISYVYQDGMNILTSTKQLV